MSATISSYSSGMQALIEDNPPCFEKNVSAERERSLKIGEFLIRPNSTDSNKITVVIRTSATTGGIKFTYSIDEQGKIDGKSTKDFIKDLIDEVIKPKFSEGKLKKGFAKAKNEKNAMRMYYLNRISGGALIAEDVHEFYVNQLCDDMLDAVSANNLQQVRYFVEILNVSANIRYPRSAIVRAFSKGHINIIRYLVENGAALDGVDGDYLCSLRLQAVASGKLEVVQYLHSPKTKPTEQVPYWTDEKLMDEAVKYNYVDIVLFFLGRMDKVEKDKKEKELLLSTANRRQINLFKEILGRQALHEEDGWSRDVLISACDSGEIEVLELLIKKGVDITQPISCLDHLGECNYTVIDIIMFSQKIRNENKVNTLQRLVAALFSSYSSVNQEERITLVAWLQTSIKRHTKMQPYRNMGTIINISCQKFLGENFTQWDLFMFKRKNKLDGDTGKFSSAKRYKTLSAEGTSQDPQRISNSY